MNEPQVATGGLQIGIVTRDLDAMVRFYGGVLGLEFVDDLVVPSGLMKRFRLGDGWLKLLHLDHVPPLHNPPGGAIGATGLRYLTVTVDDVAHALEHCVAAGCTVALPLFEFAPGVPVAIVEDPDGNALELVQPAS